MADVCDGWPYHIGIRQLVCKFHIPPLGVYSLWNLCTNICHALCWGWQTVAIENHNLPLDNSNIVCGCYYCLRQGGYVFIGVSLLVCLFVSRFTQKLLNRFSRISVERWPHGPRKKSLNFGVNPDHGVLGLGYNQVGRTTLGMEKRLFNNNNFATSATLAEVRALLCVILFVVVITALSHDIDDVPGARQKSIPWRILLISQ